MGLMHMQTTVQKKIEKDDGTESEIEFDNINVEIFDVNQILCLDY